MLADHPTMQACSRQCTLPPFSFRPKAVSIKPQRAPKHALRLQPVSARKPTAVASPEAATAASVSQQALSSTEVQPSSPGSASPPGSPRASDLDVDFALAKELSENGPRSTRRTKIVATIGPACCSPEMLEVMALEGMNIARLNMSHGTHEWHSQVIERIRKLNKDKGFSVAIMLDTEGSEVHTMELAEPLKAEIGDEFVFTVRDPSTCSGPVISVSYQSFIEDIMPGDHIIVDGGMVAFEVVNKFGPDATCRVIDPGLILSRANLTFRRSGHTLRASNSMLPVISAKDWLDIDFGIRNSVDFIAISFVKNADVITNLKSYVQSRANKQIEVVAKIESYDSVPNLPEIVDASDGVMVARGDLGAQIPLEDVPSVQKEIVVRCRQMGKPVIVASQLLQSMHELPTPTRAEVSDIADVVRQRADALMLCGETAVGRYPQKSMEVLRTVAARVEEWVRQDKHGQVALKSIGSTQQARILEEVCGSAAMMANNLKASAIFVFTRKGIMANLVSRCRPDCPVYAFTDSQEVRQRMNLRWGVSPFRVDFTENPEDNVTRTFKLLKRRELVKSGDTVVILSDLREKDQPSIDAIRSVQVRRVP